jgi:WD40 repeat protein
MQHDSMTILAIDPSGNYLATGGDDGQIRIWNATTTSLHIVPLDQKSTIRALAFSPDGSLLLAGSDDGVPRIWKVKTGEVTTGRKQAGPITNVASGSQVMSAIGGPWGFVAQFVVPGSMPLRTAGFSSENPVAALIFDPKGRYFISAVVGTEKILPRLDLYRVDGTLVSAQAFTSETTVRGLTVSPDGKHLLVTSAARPFVLLGLEANKPTRVTFSEMADGPATFSPVTQQVATSRRERGKVSWVVSTWEIPPSDDGDLTLQETGVNFISTGPTDHALLAGPKGARLWHVPSAKAVGDRWNPPGPVAACSWGARPTAWVDGTKIRAIDAKTGAPIREPWEFAGTVRALRPRAMGE